MSLSRRWIMCSSVEGVREEEEEEKEEDRGATTAVAACNYVVTRASYLLFMTFRIDPG